MSFQAQGRATQPPLGVIFNTTMDRPDAALGLAALHLASIKNDARIGAVCVTGSGLNAAILCDIIGRFYVPAVRSSNTNLPVGLDAVVPLPPDPPMAAAVIERKKENGDPQYVRSIRRLTDTSLAAAMLRNGVTMNPESVAVLSAPATSLAKSLDIAGARELYAKRVKRLVIVDIGARQKDPAALSRILSEWPSPVVFCGRDVGAELMFPGGSLDMLFAWAAVHPVADAYRAFKTMPFDAPLHDLSGLHWAIHPDSGYFQVSDSGSLTVGTDGMLRFTPGAGAVGSLRVNPSTKEEALEALVSMATSKPSPPPPGRGRAG